MEPHLLAKYFLGELLLADILHHRPQEVRIKTYNLPILAKRKRKGKLLLWTEQHGEPCLEIPLDAKIKRISGNEAETDGPTIIFGRTLC